MNVSPDQVRAATRSAADVITPERVPPLRLPEVAGAARGCPAGPAGWVTPLAAAAAIVILAVASATAGSWLARSVPAHPAAAGGTQGGPVSSSTGREKSPAPTRTPACRRITWRSQTSRRRSCEPPRPGPRWPRSRRARPSSALPGPPTTGRSSLTRSARSWADGALARPAEVLLLRLNASGARSPSPSSPIPALPKGAAVTGLALSPDGSKLAVEVDTGTYTQPGLLEIRVYTLATGAYPHLDRRTG